MIFRIPSRTVQYGYVEIKVDEPDAAVSPETVAAMYVSYVYAFQKEEEATVGRIKKGVEAPLAASQPEVDQESAGDLESAEKLLKEQLGAVKIPEEVDSDAESQAPWEGEAEVETKPKPWETKAEPPKPVVSSDW